MYIQSGGVKLSVLSKTGREAVVAMLGPGDFFGEGCLAGQPVRMGSAEAITPSVILRVGKEKMVRLLHKQRAMSDRFISHMLARNIRIEEDLIDQLFNSSEKRLARTLLLARPVRKTWSPRSGRSADFSRELLHEEVSAPCFHRLQERTEGQQLAADRRSSRLTAFRVNGSPPREFGCPRRATRFGRRAQSPRRGSHRRRS